MFSTLCMQAAYAYAFQGEISKALQVVSVEDLRYTIALKKCLYSVLDGLCKGNKAPLDVVDHFFKWHYYPRYPSHSKAILLYANYLLDSKDCSKCTAMFQLAAKAYVLTVPICYTVLRAALQLNLIKDAVYLHLFMEAISKNDANRKICEEARKILFEGGHIADPLVHPVIDSRVFSLEDARNLFSSSFEEYSMDWKTGTVDSALLPPATIDEQPGATDTRGIYKQPGATATSDN